MNWTCQHIEERLTDYLDDALSVADRAGFVAHVHQCPRCKPLVDRVNGLVANLHLVEPLEPPPGLIYRILDQTQPKQERGWFGIAWLNPRFAMGAFSVAVVMLLVWPTAFTDVKNMTWSDLKPTSIYHAADRRATLMYARGVKFVNGLRVLHEIQSRLGTSDTPEALPVKEELKKRTEDEQNKSDNEKKREQNHAFEPTHIPTVLASAFLGMSGGLNP